MRTTSIPHPVRSWRSALVVACLVGTMAVCGVLANEVRDARNALRATAAQTLQDYAGYVGRVVGTELFRDAQTMREDLFAPVSRPTNGPPVSVDSFAMHADSVFAKLRVGHDRLRGYERLDLGKMQWTTRGALRDTAFGKLVADTMIAMRLSPQVYPTAGVMLVTFDSSTVSLYYRMANDSTSHQMYAYVISQTRAAVFDAMVSKTLRTVPLLPPSFAGSQWNVDAPSAPRVPTDSLVGVRIVGLDGRLLYRSSRWFDTPYRASYEFQTGPGGFTIETALRPGLEQRLVPADVDQASRTLYLSLALLGGFLLAVSFVAFWGEMRQRDVQRTRAMRQLTTGLRHELNNALASVLLEAQLLESAAEPGGQVHDSAGAIAEQAQRMRDVLRRLDRVEHLPVVDYIDGQSMVDLAATATRRTSPVPPDPDAPPGKASAA